MNLRQTLNLKQDDVIGLDIGSCSVKIVVLGIDENGYKIKAAGIAQISDYHSGNHQSQVRATSDEARDTVKAIRESLASARLRAKAKLRANYAVCGVSGSDVAVRDFEFPVLPPEDIEGAVALEAAQVCPFNADQAAVDYQLVSEQNQTAKTRGFLVAATNVLVTNRIQLAKEAGLKCVLMDIDGLALLNCFHGLSNIPEKGSAAILNVGGTYSTMAVMNNDGWPFIRETAYAGNDVLRHISGANDISVEALKGVLFDDAEEVESDLADSMEKASEELVSGVSETLRFYAAQERSVPITKIYVCGGFASAKGFIELLNRKLPLESILWNPFDNVRCDASHGCQDILGKNGHSLAVAAGLAMRSI